MYHDMRTTSIIIITLDEGKKGEKVQTDRSGVRLEEEGKHSSTSEQGKESVDCNRKGR